jgi:hypothetical protein
MSISSDIRRGDVHATFGICRLSHGIGIFAEQSGRGQRVMSPKVAGKNRTIHFQ